MSCCSDAPLGQSVPRLMGWSGSPSTWITCGVTFFALSPMVWMMTPQLTAQYGHVLRVSVEREIFSAWACASSGCASKPNAVSPMTPAKPVLTNARLETSMAETSGNRTCEIGVKRTGERWSAEAFTGERFGMSDDWLTTPTCRDAIDRNQLPFKNEMTLHLPAEGRQ